MSTPQDEKIHRLVAGWRYSAARAGRWYYTSGGKAPLPGGLEAV